MAIKLGYEAIKFILTKEFMRKSGTRGITTIPGKAHDMRMKQLVDAMAKKMRDLGYDVNKVTEKNVQGLLDSSRAMEKQKKLKVISQGDPEFQGITDKLLGKKAKVHPFQGFTARVQQDVDGIIKNLKSMEPMDAMKEANLIIGRKGNYKHLSGDEAQRILKETDDHIFQRDIKPDPEDMASGGIAGQLHLNRPGYGGGKLVLDTLLKLLKGAGKKKDLYKHIDMDKLMKGKDKIKVYSGSVERPSNTWQSFIEDAEAFGTTPEKIAKDNFKDQWFTPFKSYAEGFTSPKDLASKMRTVDLTPKEIAIAKRYVEKINKTDTISMRKKLGLKPYPKHHVTTDENLVLIPRYKLKELEKSGRMKKDYMILEKLKKKLGLAEGGIAGQLHLNRPGYQTGAMVNKPIAEAKAVTTAAPERKMPFENYYVGANPTAEQATFMQEKGAVPLSDKWRQHAEFSQAAKGLTGQGVIPEYGMQTGYDFQKKFGYDPKVSAVLSLGYQGLTEGLGMFNPKNPNFLNPIETGKTIYGDYKKNVEGILAADTGTLTAEQLAARNKYLESQGQPTETMAATPTQQPTNVPGTPIVPTRSTIPMNLFDRYLDIQSTSPADPSTGYVGRTAEQALERGLRGFEGTRRFQTLPGGWKDVEADKEDIYNFITGHTKSFSPDLTSIYHGGDLDKYLTDFYDYKYGHPSGQPGKLHYSGEAGHGVRPDVFSKYFTKDYGYGQALASGGIAGQLHLNRPGLQRGGPPGGGDPEMTYTAPSRRGPPGGGDPRMTYTAPANLPPSMRGGAPDALWTPPVQDLSKRERPLGMRSLGAKQLPLPLLKQHKFKILPQSWMRLYQDLEEQADLLNPAEMGLATDLRHDAIMKNFSYLLELQGQGKINQDLSQLDLFKTAIENIERNYMKDKATTMKESITISPPEEEEPGQWVAKGGRVGMGKGGLAHVLGV